MEPISYHVYNRGVKKQPIFFCDADYIRFFERFADYSEVDNIRFYALVLMPNHLHFIPVEGTERVTVTKFMHRLSTSYAMYFNCKYKGSGHVFQGNFRAKPIEDAFSLLTRLRYVYQNPMELIKGHRWSQGVHKMRSHKWSSYRWFFEAGAPDWLCKDEVLGPFLSDATRFSAFIESPKPRLDLG